MSADDPRRDIDAEVTRVLAQQLLGAALPAELAHVVLAAVGAAFLVGHVPPADAGLWGSAVAAGGAGGAAGGGAAGGGEGAAAVGGGGGAVVGVAAGAQAVMIIAATDSKLITNHQFLLRNMCFSS